MPANLEDSAVATGLEKVKFWFQSQRKAMPKNVQETPQLHSFHLLTKAQNSSSQASTVHETSTSRYQGGFRKGSESRDQIANICWIIENTRECQKKIYFCFIMPKALTVWITINCGKFWKRWEYQTTWPASWEICMQAKKQQLELHMEQQTGSNRKRSMSRLYIVTLLI